MSAAALEAFYSRPMDAIVADPALADLLSDEGPIPNPRYPTNGMPELTAKASSDSSGPGKGLFVTE